MTDNKSMSLGGGAWFQFEAYGDGFDNYEIIDVVQQQQTEMKDNAPAYWDAAKTQPKMMLRVELEDENGDIVNVGLKGKRTLEADGTGSSLAAVSKAIKDATGGNDITVGDRLSMHYVREGTASKGMSAPKLYSATYAKKSTSVTVASAPAQTPAPVVATPGSVMTNEQIAALIAANAGAVADPIAAHPQGAQLRAAGISDDQIRLALGIAA